MTIEAEVSNTGDVAGDVVVQLYIHQQFGSASRPIRELKGFRARQLAAERVEERTIRRDSGGPYLLERSEAAGGSRRRPLSTSGLAKTQRRNYRDSSR